jgi:hypothetical protein
VNSKYDGEKFLTREDGVTKATPLLLVLVVIELTGKWTRIHQECYLAGIDSVQLDGSAGFKQHSNSMSAGTGHI